MTFHLGLGRYVGNMNANEIISISMPDHTITYKKKLSDKVSSFPLISIRKPFYNSFIEVAYGREFSQINLDTEVYFRGKTLEFTSAVDISRHRLPVELSTMVYSYNFKKRRTSLYLTFGLELSVRKIKFNRNYDEHVEMYDIITSKDNVTLTETIFDFNGRSIRLNSGFMINFNNVFKRTIGLKTTYSFSRASTVVIHSKVDSNTGSSLVSWRFNHSGLYLHLIVPFCKDP